MLARLLVVGAERNLTLKNALTYNLCTYPPAIANADELICIATKSAIMGYILGSSDILVSAPIPESSPMIFDGMAILQQLTKLPNTFGELALF